ncbi:MAG: restriction endonuclease [Planctomycetes bacterium]|nr:restriction endonuclease [Planctomycetota bacterium]
MTDIWMVRAGRGGRLIDRFLEASWMTIGCANIAGPAVLSMGREDLVAHTAAANPTWNTHKVANQAGQIYRFVHEVQVGDVVTTYDPSQRRYLLGRVTGPVECVENGLWSRKVDWTQRVSRDLLSVETRNTLGAILTIFRLGESASQELLRNAVDLGAPETVAPATREPSTTEVVATAATSVEDLVQENIEKAQEFVEDRIASLDPYEMQDLVAGILRALGYKTQVAGRGSDRGVDIFASPDGLGLEEPRIFVEVKHRVSTPMGSQDLRSFMGGRQPGDRCLFVSTGGFSKDARYEAERSNVPLTLIGLPQLRELLLEHYESVDAETKRLVPLVRMYWPATKD